MCWNNISTGYTTLVADDACFTWLSSAKHSGRIVTVNNLRPSPISIYFNFWLQCVSVCARARALMLLPSSSCHCFNLKSNKSNKFSHFKDLWTESSVIFVSNIAHGYGMNFNDRTCAFSVVGRRWWQTRHHRHRLFDSYSIYSMVYCHRTRIFILLLRLAHVNFRWTLDRDDIRWTMIKKP